MAGGEPDAVRRGHDGRPRRGIPARAAGVCDDEALPPAPFRGVPRLGRLVEQVGQAGTPGGLDAADVAVAAIQPDAPGTERDEWRRIERSTRAVGARALRHSCSRRGAERTASGPAPPALATPFPAAL